MLIQTIDGRILYVDMYGHILAEYSDGQWYAYIHNEKYLIIDDK